MATEQRSKRQLTLRMRLALGYSAFFALVLVLLGTGVILTMRNVMYAQIDTALQTDSTLVQDDFDASNSDLTEYFRDKSFLLRIHGPRIEGLESATLYVQVMDAHGQMLATSPSLQQETLPLNDATRAAAMAGDSKIIESILGGARVRMLVSPLLADQRIVGVLLVAQSLREVEQTLRLLVISLAATSLIALLAGVRGGAWLAERSLLPVAEVARTARQIVRAEDLAQRVRAASSDDELGQLVSTVNEMLERLETLFTSQHRFVADVSHELRTPLTAMRGNLEILRRGAARDPQALDASLAAMEREVNRLVRLASDLLLLAQVELGVTLRHEPVALDELVLEVIRDLAPLANGITMKPAVSEQIEVRGDRDRIKQALLNMVVNALQHTPADGKVTITLARQDSHASISVCDTGEGITTKDLPFVFDRFYRTDKARSRVTGGAGLGLAIVKWVAEAHNGNVDVQSTPGYGSTFTLWLPLDSAATA